MIVSSLEAIGHSIEPIIKPNDYIKCAHYARYASSDWFNRMRGITVVLAGLGGIGSYVAYLLSRLELFKVIMYDPDTVDLVNLSGQLYSKNHIGLPKTEAIVDTIENYSLYTRYEAYNLPYTDESNTADIMICGFDNMEARKVFFNNWLGHVNNLEEYKRKRCLFIDGRLNAEDFQVFCIAGDDTYNINKYYEEYLFTDGEADITTCSYKQTSYMATMIGSIMINLFVNFTSNIANNLNIRDLPFKTSYDGRSMFFKSNN